MTIYFYHIHEKPYGCFSNFSRHGIELDEQWWPTTEHYFQAQKFPGSPYAELIRLAEGPMQAAEMGRNRSYPLRRDWERAKDEVMFKAVLCKFQTHPDLRAILLATGEEDIIEKTTHDYYWGCGTDGTGKNMLGVTLVRVRDTLREEENN